MSENFDNLQMFYKRLDPGVAGLIGAGLGWMLSDTLVNTPRGRWTPQQQMEWERTIERASKRSRDRKLLNLLRRKDVTIEKRWRNPAATIGSAAGRAIAGNSLKNSAPQPSEKERKKSLTDAYKRQQIRPQMKNITTPLQDRKNIKWSKAPSKRLEGAGPAVDHDRSADPVFARRGRGRKPALLHPSTSPNVSGARHARYTEQNIKKDLFNRAAKPAKGGGAVKPKLMSLLARKPSRKKIRREINRRDSERWSTGYGNMQADQDIEKDHLSVPPRQGLIFDPAKKRWTNPDNVGKTVTDVQGRKRIRGTGTGVHEGKLAEGTTGGKGEGSAVAGRKFRDPADVEVQETEKKKPKKVSASALERFKEDKKEEDKKETKKRVEARRN
tara:strand:- start:157 stop:1311 length:1155 start_codon:yes stop_codon:yes gene_type:complete